MSNFGANGTRAEIALLRNVLRLTRPRDFVVDAKGETVFRQRAPFFVYESVTNARIQTALLRDDLPARATAMHACFVSTLMADRLPPAGLSFIQRNYLPINHDVSVAGCRIPSSDGQNGGYFETVIPPNTTLLPSIHRSRVNSMASVMMARSFCAQAVIGSSPCNRTKRWR